MTEITSKPLTTIFYSWQSDLPNNTNRTFIETCLKKAIKELHREDELEVDVCIDRDTQDVAGTPHIPKTILEKIDAADVFVGDVTIVAKYKQHDGADKASPNPNVLIELGYAVKSLGWAQVICVANTHYGALKDLPFDLDKHRIVNYQSSGPDDKAAAEKALMPQLKDKIVKSLAVAVPRRGPEVEAFFADSETKESLGQRFRLCVSRIEGVQRDEMPNYLQKGQISFGGQTIRTSVSSLVDGRVNGDYYWEFFDYFEIANSAQRIRFGLANQSPALLTGVKFRFRLSDCPTLIALEHDDVVLPLKRLRPGDRIHGLMHKSHPGIVSVRDDLLEVDFGKIQSGDAIISDRFWIGSDATGETKITAKVFSDQFGPKEVELVVDSEVKVREVTKDELFKILDEFDQRFGSESADEDDD